MFYRTQLREGVAKLLNHLPQGAVDLYEEMRSCIWRKDGGGSTSELKASVREGRLRVRLSQKNMARNSGVAERTVRRWVKALSDAGLVRREMKATQQGRVVHYDLGRREIVEVPIIENGQQTGTRPVVYDRLYLHAYLDLWTERVEDLVARGMVEAMAHRKARESVQSRMSPVGPRVSGADRTRGDRSPVYKEGNRKRERKENPEDGGGARALTRATPSSSEEPRQDAAARSEISAAARWTSDGASAARSRRPAAQTAKSPRPPCCARPPSPAAKCDATTTTTQQTIEDEMGKRPWNKTEMAEYEDWHAEDDEDLAHEAGDGAEEAEEEGSRRGFGGRKRKRLKPPSRPQPVDPDHGDPELMAIATMSAVRSLRRKPKRERRNGAQLARDLTAIRALWMVFGEACREAYPDDVFKAEVPGERSPEVKGLMWLIEQRGQDGAREIVEALVMSWERLREARLVRDLVPDLGIFNTRMATKVHAWLRRHGASGSDRAKVMAVKKRLEAHYEEQGGWTTYLPPDLREAVDTVKPIAERLGIDL